MKLRSALIAAVALASTALGAAPAIANSSLNMAVQFSPAPPRQGLETITVRLTDAQHRPVNGATVSIASNMPMMSMSGPTVRATARGAGIYVASVNLNFATRWAFTAVARSGKMTAKHVTEIDVK